MPAIAGDLMRPLLIFGASADRTTPFDTDQQAAYDVAAPPRALVRINGAGHLDFSDLCTVAVARAFLDDGCDPMMLDPEIVHRRVETIGVAFLRRHLDGDLTADAALEQSAVEALGNLDYWRDP
jgi:predicted dienelactone hydrolase